jgi:hypothetical protein
MSYNIILNSDNVNNGNNSQYKFNFISGNFTVKSEAQICVSQIQIPYSWFNITEEYQNNKFDIIDWLGNIYNVILPNGFYTITDINQFLEIYSVNNGLYLINNNGQNVYYLQIFTNQQYYRNQLLFYPVPTSLPVGWVLPSNFVGFPAVSVCPQFIVLNNNFTIYSGFNPGTYGGGNIPLSVLSQNVPLGSNINSLVIRCNLCNNAIGFPSDILDTFAIEGVFGANLNYAPGFEKWVKIQPGTYNSLIIDFVDERYNQINILDNNVTISLLLKNK